MGRTDRDPATRAHTNPFETACALSVQSATKKGSASLLVIEEKQPAPAKLGDLSFLSTLDDVADDSADAVSDVVEDVADATAAATTGTVDTAARGVNGIIATGERFIKDATETVRETATELFSTSSNARAAPARQQPSQMQQQQQPEAQTRQQPPQTASAARSVAPHYSVSGNASMVVAQDTHEAPFFSIAPEHFRAARDRYHKENFGSLPEEGFGAKALPVTAMISGAAFVVVPHPAVGFKTVAFPGSVHGVVHEPDMGAGIKSQSSLPDFANRLGSGSGAHCCAIPTYGAGHKMDLRGLAMHPDAQSCTKSKEEIQQESVTFSGGKVMVHEGSIGHLCAGNTSLGHALKSACISDAGSNSRVFTGISDADVTASMPQIARTYNGALPIHDLSKNGLRVEWTPVAPQGGHASFADALSGYPSGSKLHIHANYTVAMHDPSAEEDL